ncbi:MAG: hypothetical protein P4L40_05245 [Terracidiphilus sp.]|nr:hypothetical protein [Terracidiphilus sp.]
MASYEFEQSLRRKPFSPRTPTRKPSFRVGDALGTSNGSSRLLRPDSSRFATDHIIDSLVTDPFSPKGSPRGRSRPSPYYEARDDGGGDAAGNPYAAMSPTARGRTGREFYPYHDPAAASPRAASPRRSPSPRRDERRDLSPRPQPYALQPYPSAPQQSYGYMPQQMMGQYPVPVPQAGYSVAPMSPKPTSMRGPFGPIPAAPTASPGYVMDLAPGPLGTLLACYLI